jgi:catechol 2,3-dioxygenase-like lactoylglutathione lyase family enzyme
MLRLLLLPLLLLPCLAGASNDALAPSSSADDALTSPLRRITVSTNSLAESLLFYREGMGLSLQGPLTQAADERAMWRSVWQLDPELQWQRYRLHRPGTDGVAEIELLVFQQQQPAIHSSWSALELGPFSMGFPNAGQVDQDAAVRKLGFGALNTIEIYSVPRPDGSEYEIEETIFNGPDFVHGVGIHRGDGMAQLGPLDSRGLGGPAYSAQVVKDSQTMIDFMTGVMGWELRSDRTWQSAGTKGALNVPDGTVFRFSILYSPGASSGHVLLVDYENAETIPAQAAPRVPHRGIGMWTVSTTDLEEVKRRALGAEVLQADWSSRGLLVLEAPNGFLISVIEEK